MQRVLMMSRPRCGDAHEDPEELFLPLSELERAVVGVERLGVGPHGRGEHRKSELLVRIVGVERSLALQAAKLLLDLTWSVCGDRHLVGHRHGLTLANGPGRSGGGCARETSADGRPVDGMVARV